MGRLRFDEQNASVNGTTTGRRDDKYNLSERTTIRYGSPEHQAVLAQMRDEASRMSDSPMLAATVNPASLVKNSL